MCFAKTVIIIESVKEIEISNLYKFLNLSMYKSSDFFLALIIAGNKDEVIETVINSHISLSLTATA